MSDGLRRLLAPRSIALLGASSDPRKFGGRPIQALRRHGFRGDLHVVNARRDEVQGLPSLPSPAELPDGVDLAVCLLPAKQTLPALEACAERDVGAAAVFSGGFRESGPEGERRERDLVHLAREASMRLLGPNTPGFVNLPAGVVCSASGFATREELRAGRLSFLLQSGGVAGILCDRAFDAGLGVAYAVCTGNEADVSLAELLRFVTREPGTRAVGLFLEGIPAGFPDAVREARQAGVGIAALKAGRSDQARAIAASHTGAIVGSDEAFDALCASLGVVRTRDYAELLEATAVLAGSAWAGARVAVIGASGGMNAVLADAAADAGLELPELGPSTVRRLAELTPDFGSAGNPVDISSVLLVDPACLGAAVEAVAADPSVDGVLVAVGDHPPALSELLADAVLAAAGTIEVPLAVQWSAGSLSQPGVTALGRGGVPVLAEPARCLRTLAAAVRAARADLGSRPVEITPPSRNGWSEGEAKALLARAGIPAPGPPGPHDEAVVKADCVGTVHKTEIGAVRVGVAPERREAAGVQVVEAARAAVGADRVRGVIVERMLHPVVELVLSVHLDPQLGPIVTLGTGGELVELAGDMSSRLAPVDEQEAEAMISELTAARLLDGFRGRPAGDRVTLARAVSALSRLGASWGPALGVIEVNPLAVLEDGVAALDAVVEVSL